jgi:hypothetical protein
MTEARDETGRFQPGHSGNPTGRRKGSKNRATLWAEAMLKGNAEEVMRAVMERAKGGDAVAQRFVLSRLLPPARERCVSLPGLPAPSGWPAQDARAAFHLIRSALAEGEVSSGEALKLLDFFTRGRAIEDAALEEDWQQEAQEAAEAKRKQQEEAAADAKAQQWWEEEEDEEERQRRDEEEVRQRTVASPADSPADAGTPVARSGPPFATAWISCGFATADRPPIAYATDDAGNPLPLPPVVLTAS